MTEDNFLRCVLIALEQKRGSSGLQYINESIALKQLQDLKYITITNGRVKLVAETFNTPINQLDPWCAPIMIALFSTQWLLDLCNKG